MANSDQNDEIDFPLGNPRSHLRRDLDAHAGLVARRHSLWVDDEEQSSLPGRRRQHFSWHNAGEMAGIVGTLSNPTMWLSVLVADPRFRNVVKAIANARHSGGRMLGSQTNQVLSGILASVLPALVQMAEAAAVGAFAGGVAGIFAGFGVGDEVTIPGGAIAGAEMGLAVAGFVGLGQMLAQGGLHFATFVRLIAEATTLALFAGENQGMYGGGRGFSYDEDMRDASELYAAALGELWWLALQAIVLWVLKKAVEVGGPAAGKLAGRAVRSEALQSAIGAAKGKVGKLGTTFCDWLDRDFEGIRDLVAKHERAARQAESGVSHVDENMPAPASRNKPRLALNRFQTKPNEAFFWSGKTNGVGGADAAGKIAGANGGTTLEQLTVNKGIELPAWDPNDPASVQSWTDASRSYADGASGTVRAVIGSSLRPGNVWETTELPALMANPNVTQIIQIDPLTGISNVIFSR